MRGRVSALRRRVGARIKTRRLVREVRASGVFDEAWYRSQLDELLGPGQDAVVHYVREGARHGLSPSPLFDPEWYRRLAKGTGPSIQGTFAHYLRHGITRRTSPHPVVDPVYYLDRCPEAPQHRAGVLGHYLEVGWRQGVEVNGWFDSRAYARWRLDYTGDEPAVVHFLRWATPSVWAASDPRTLDAAGPAREGITADRSNRQRTALALRERADELVDWRSAAGRDGVPGRTSIVIGASSAARRVERCVAAVWSTTREADIEVIVADDTRAGEDAYRLLSLASRHPGTRVLRRRPWEVLHAAILANLGIASATGDVVVLLDPSVIVQRDWLEPLVGPVRRGEAVAAQPLILTSAGSVLSTGFTMPPHGSPYPALHGFPEHAHAVAKSADRMALSRSCLAVRHADVVAVKGFDPTFLQVFGDVDLSRRLAARRDAPLRYEPASTVVQADTAMHCSPDVLEQDRLVFEERWAGRLPNDEAAVLSAAGVRPSQHPPADTTGGQTSGPVLEWIEDRARPQRWAIKVATPNVHRRLRWGDWHFAVALRDALRRIGHEVVVDLHPAWHRPTAHLDDVVVLLRGLEPYRPDPAQINLLWLISHPDLVTDDELEGFDWLLVASETFARKLAGRAQVPTEALLQCTDPARFAPGPATEPGHELLFVGNSRGQLRPIVADALAARLPLSVYGARWEKLIPAEVVIDGYLPNESLGAAYRNAGVVLCDHWDDMRREGFLSNRLFDLTACGAAVVSDQVKGIEETFDGLVRTYSHPEGLAAVVREVLHRRDEEADERLELAQRVARDHSFDARAARLSEVATNLCARAGAAPPLGWHERFTPMRPGGAG